MSQMPVLHTLPLKLILGLVFLLFSFRQDDSRRKLLLKTKFDSCVVDNIGNIYTINGAEVLKYLPNGKFFARYSDLSLGRVSWLDATNPLKILLYYKDFQQLVFLDNQLSVNSNQVSLENLGYEQTELVCAGANNSFWIYDKKNNELLRFNENSQKVSSTGNLKQILRLELEPDFMIEYNGFLYLNSPEQGIFVFDFYGAFSKLIPLKNLHRFRIDEDLVYFRRDSVYCSYNFRLLEELCKTLPPGENLKDVQVFKDGVYLVYQDSLLRLAP